MLGDAVVDAAIDSMREKLSALTPVHPISPDLHGERRQAMILLADVKGSTELAEQVDAETWVEIMNRVFYLLGDSIYRYGGEIDQHRGDGLVAFFGAKAAHEDDPERTVRAALAMQEAIKGYAAELKAAHGIDLLLRVGVNTGEVIATEVGDRHRHSEDMAMGRAIGSAAGHGAGHRQHLSPDPAFVRMAGAGRDPGQGRQPAGDRVPAPGRQSHRRQMARHRRAVLAAGGPRRGTRRAAQGGRRSAAWRGRDRDPVGEAGIGKSRLVAELRKRVPGEQVQWFEGRCLSYGGSIAYLPWLDVMQTLVERAAKQRPLVLVCEDLHWADATSLALTIAFRSRRGMRS